MPSRARSAAAFGLTFLLGAAAGVGADRAVAPRPGPAATDRPARLVGSWVDDRDGRTATFRGDLTFEVTGRTAAEPDRKGETGAQAADRERNHSGHYRWVDDRHVEVRTPNNVETYEVFFDGDVVGMLRDDGYSWRGQRRP